MKTLLNLRLGQQLIITPQLQQAIKLLQLPLLELEQEVKQILDSNIMLEIQDEDSIQTDITDFTPQSYNKIPDDETIEPKDPNCSSLNTYLHWQVNLAHFNEIEKVIADAIIDSLEDDGYLKTELNTIQIKLEQDLGISIKHINLEQVLNKIQHFDPLGIAARSVQECLLIQVMQLTAEPNLIKIAEKLITNHLDLLAHKKFKRLQSILKINDVTLKAAIKIINQLNPKPAHSYVATDQNYIIPDVIVIHKNNKWEVELNLRSLDKIKINNAYADLLKANNSHEHQIFKEQLTEAKWLLKSISTRNATLLKVAKIIVAAEEDFFNYGESFLKPITLQFVAELADVHPSTVSRITANTYMLSPRGTYSLKYFFSSYVDTESGNQCSKVAVQAAIKKLVGQEKSTQTALTDEEIAALLKTDGINIARRTVSEYRKDLGIPSVNKRRQQIKLKE